MPQAADEPITAILAQIQAGDAAARDRLFTRVYDELRRMAGGIVRGDPIAAATSLVHDLWIKIRDNELMKDPPNRGFFFGAAANALRCLLVDRRRKLRREHALRVPFDDTIDAVDRHLERAGLVDLLSLDEALTRLADVDARQARVVELKLFGGFDAAEIAEMIDMSVSTVQGDLRSAAGWLREHLAEDRATGGA